MVVGSRIASANIIILEDLNLAFWYEITIHKILYIRVKFVKADHLTAKFNFLPNFLALWYIPLVCVQN